MGIERDMQVEDLLRIPGSIAWCIRHGVSLFSCHGAFPDTLGRLLELKGVADVDGFVRAMDEELGRGTGGS